MIRQTVNRWLNDKRFAIFRVDPPWLARSKKPQGARMCGVKGRVHHYVTPVKEGRVIVELGGKITYNEVPYTVCCTYNLTVSY